MELFSHPETPNGGQGSVQNNTPQAPLKLANETLHTPNIVGYIVGYAVLHDSVIGRVLPLDGT